MRGVARYKKFTPTFIANMAFILEHSKVSYTSLGTIFGLDVDTISSLKSADSKGATNIKLTTNFEIHLRKLRNIQAREILAQRHEIVSTLNVFLVTPNDKPIDFLSVGQKQCIADMALNTCVSFQETARTLNLKEETLMAIISEVGTTPTTRRALIPPLVENALRLLADVNDQKFDPRYRAIERKLKMNNHKVNTSVNTQTATRQSSQPTF